MNTQNSLYLGSSSQSRQMLLKQARIPFSLIKQSADETLCDWNLPLPEVVKHIALYKMAHCLLPKAQEGDICFVLTADTLSRDPRGTIQGKTASKADAIAILRSIRKGLVTTGTAFCLERKRYSNGLWITEEQILEYVQAQYIFDVPDAWIEIYMQSFDGQLGTASINIEEFGNLFLKELRGSYATVVGLPLYELRQALEKIGFYR